jgi:undecaprenyl-diphosphatase
MPSGDDHRSICENRFQRLALAWGERLACDSPTEEEQMGSRSPDAYNRGMSLFDVVLLSIVQGLAELLPVSSSAHVVVAEKLMGLDPSSPPMTLLLVMLHTGTMFAVIVYFWRRWRERFFQNAKTFRRFAWLVIVATILTAAIGGSLIKIIEGTATHRVPHGEIEELFGRLELIAPALAGAGILILISAFAERRKPEAARSADDLSTKKAGIIGIVQGFCLPFRGFSRSGATISTGLLVGVGKSRAEDFSFALAVVLTPPVVVREAMRLVRAEQISGITTLASAMMPSMVGAICAFLAGLLALKWLSRWLESGRWYLFGIYCLVAAAGVAALHLLGY